MHKRLTTEDFIKRAKKVHRDEYDYSNVIYVNAKVKVDIHCIKHGIFQQTPDNHLQGKSCSKCKREENALKRKYSTEEFINKAISKHGNLYDYSKVNYKGWQSKVVIICKTHGEFEQNASSHLSGAGCIKCGGSRKSTTEEFIIKANKEYKGYYEYSLVDYKLAHTKVKIICPTHGVFKQTPTSHLNGNGCKGCANERVSESLGASKEDFVKDSHSIHKYFYDYDLSKYKNLKSKIDINCPIHGVFNQLAEAHKRGQGCPKCSYGNFINRLSYSGWKQLGKQSKNFDSFKVYIIKCWNDNEEFYKIGKTYNKIKKRFKTTVMMPYEYKVVKIIEGTAEKVSKLERSMQEKNKDYRYLPEINFNGMHECYSDLIKENF